MKNTLQLACVFLTAFSLFACGNSATSTSTTLTPLAILTAEANPQLGGILSTGVYNTTTLSSGFSASNPYWVFNANSFNGNYIAPADGYVARIAVGTINGTSYTYVTLIHSAHLATRVFGMQVVQVRPGDTVVAGSIMGSYLNSGSVAFQVLVDNTPVCPLSYMTAAFRTSLAANGYYTQLCN
jgi:murein DD-endopeptidase MepM/ murein hydrolase activator NlpD